jgi:hypothetical protein
MSDDSKTNPCDAWFWDGSAEYEGVLVRRDGSSFLARLRQVRRGGAPPLGRRSSASALEAQRLFSRRRFLAHFPGGPEEALLQAEFNSVQPSSDGEFEVLVSGLLQPLDERQKELLRHLPADSAARLLPRRVS